MFNPPGAAGPRAGPSSFDFTPDLDQNRPKRGEARHPRAAGHRGRARAEGRARRRVNQGRDGFTLLQVLIALGMLMVAFLAIIRLSLMADTVNVDQSLSTEAQAFFRAVELALQDDLLCTCNLAGKVFKDPTPEADLAAQEPLRRESVELELREWEDSCRTQGPPMAPATRSAARAVTLRGTRLENFVQFSEGHYLADVRVDLERVAPNNPKDSRRMSRSFPIKFEALRDPRTSETRILRCSRPRALGDRLIATVREYKRPLQSRIVIRGERFPDARYARIQVRGRRVGDLGEPAPEPSVAPEPYPRPSDEPLERVVFKPVYHEPPDSFLEAAGGTDLLGWDLWIDYEKRVFSGTVFLAGGPEGNRTTLYAFRESPGLMLRELGQVELGEPCFRGPSAGIMNCLKPGVALYAPLNMGFSFRWEKRDSRDLVLESLPHVGWDQYWVEEFYQ